MYGLAKVAFDYDKVYDDNPDLDQLRIKEIEETEQLDQKEEVWKNERKKSMVTPGLVGGGIGAGALLGLNQLTSKQVPSTPVRSGGIGLAMGALVGAGLAGKRFDKTSPLAEGLEQSRLSAGNAQADHINRWSELYEQHHEN